MFVVVLVTCVVYEMVLVAKTGLRVPDEILKADKLALVENVGVFNIIFTLFNRLVTTGMSNFPSPSMSPMAKA